MSSSITSLRNARDPTDMYIQFNNADVGPLLLNFTSTIKLDSPWKAKALVSIFYSKIPDYNPSADNGWYNNSYVFNVPSHLVDVFIAHRVKSFVVQLQHKNRHPILVLSSIQEYHPPIEKWVFPKTAYYMKLMTILPTFIPTPLPPIPE